MAAANQHLTAKEKHPHNPQPTVASPQPSARANLDVRDQHWTEAATGSLSPTAVVSRPRVAVAADLATVDAAGNQQRGDGAENQP